MHYTWCTDAYSSANDVFFLFFVAISIGAITIDGIFALGHHAIFWVQRSVPLTSMECRRIARSSFCWAVEQPLQRKLWLFFGFRGHDWCCLCSTMVHIWRSLLLSRIVFTRFATWCGRPLMVSDKYTVESILTIHTHHLAGMYHRCMKLIVFLESMVRNLVSRAYHLVSRKQTRQDKIIRWNKYWNTYLRTVELSSKWIVMPRIWQ